MNIKSYSCMYFNDGENFHTINIHVVEHPAKLVCYDYILKTGSSLQQSYNSRFLLIFFVLGSVLIRPTE